jgi:hypothetical protein
MKNIESQSKLINRRSKDLYDFIADFHHFEKFLPEQVSDWNVTDSACSFNLPNLGKITLRMEKDDMAQWVKYIGISGPTLFELLCELKPKTETTCHLTLTAFADVPTFMLMMISKPVKNFVTTVLDKIAKLAEN